MKKSTFQPFLGQFFGIILWTLVLVYPIALMNGYDAHGDVRLAATSIIFAIFAWNYYYPLARTFFPGAEESTISDAFIAVSLIPIAGALWYYNVLKPQWLKKLERLSLQKEFDGIAEWVKSNPLSPLCQEDFKWLFDLADQLNCHNRIGDIIMEASETLTMSVPETQKKLDRLTAYQGMIERRENVTPVSEEEIKAMETERQCLQATINRDRHNLRNMRNWITGDGIINRSSTRALIESLQE